MKRTFFMKNPKIINLCGADYFDVCANKSNKKRIGHIDIFRRKIGMESVEIISGDILYISLPIRCSRQVHKDRVVKFIKESFGSMSNDLSIIV